MSESKILMSAKGLTKRFGGLAAVNDVSLDLWHGKLHAVIGPNGAGKSTLTNLLSGDLPPTSGTITLDGHDITPTGGVQLFLFRVADEEGSLAEVRDLIAARLAGEVTCEVYEYDDDQEEWIYDDEQAA